MPIRHPLADKVARVPASKSITNRELVLSALARGVSRLEVGPLDPGDDVRAMRSAVAALGYAVEAGGRERIVVSGSERAPGVDAVLDAAEAGTVARFGLALAALGAGTVRVDGSPRLRERPLAGLVRALRALGASVDRDSLPLSIRGPLAGGAVTVAVNESSQFASALLLVAPRLPKGLRLRVAGHLVSGPFLELTVSSLAARGVRVVRPGPREFVIAPQLVKARTLHVGGDATAASYAAAAAAILGGSVTIPGVEAREGHADQGDVRVFDLLARMGCAVHRAPGRVTVRRQGALQGITANVGDCSDVFPTLAVVAAFARSATELLGIGHTRKQESDRIATVVAGLAAMGARVEGYADAIRIEPATLQGAAIESAGDHRIAMAFSIAGLQVPGVSVEGADSVKKTFPGFYEMLEEFAR